MWSYLSQAHLTVSERGRRQLGRNETFQLTICSTLCFTFTQWLNDKSIPYVLDHAAVYSLTTFDWTFQVGGQPKISKNREGDRKEKWQAGNVLQVFDELTFRGNVLPS